MFGGVRTVVRNISPSIGDFIALHMLYLSRASVASRCPNAASPPERTAIVPDANWGSLPMNIIIFAEYAGSSTMPSSAANCVAKRMTAAGTDPKAAPTGGRTARQLAGRSVPPEPSLR